MLRCTFFALALLGATALTAHTKTAPPDLSGAWLISYSLPGGTREANLCILKIETKDGKPTASVVAVPKGTNITLKSFDVSNKEVTVALANGPSFIGVISDDAKTILGGFGTDAAQSRGKMVRTGQESIDSRFTSSEAPAELVKAEQLTTRPNMLRIQIIQTKEADKKKELMAEMSEVQKEAEEKLPGLYRAVIEKKADTPIALDAALPLLQSARKWKVTASEAKNLLKIIEAQSTRFGPKYSDFVTLEAAESLVATKGLEAIAVGVLRTRSKGLTDKDPAAFQVRVLTASKTALEASGATDEAKVVDGRLGKIEARLDQEYLATVPPFKPTLFAGRQEKGANQVAVLELFTGAQCPPCVAADVAFDALGKSYSPSEVVLIQYHMHIPGPDPLTNPDTIARWDYYRKLFPQGVRGTPTTIFNGKVQAGGGGGMANAQSKFTQYREIIDQILEKTTSVKLSGKAIQKDDKIEIAVDVAGAPTEGELKLRVLVVEESIRYVGGNRLRFHHHVVRAIPGGAAGVTVKEANLRHTTTADLLAVRKDLNNYLDDYAANERPFPSKVCPLDLKHLKVIALIQDDKTGEILQAAQIEVDDKVASGGQ
jgi:hypothetical protein